MVLMNQLYKIMPSHRVPSLNSNVLIVEHNQLASGVLATF